jgi:hypothetical protein
MTPAMKAAQPTGSSKPCTQRVIASGLAAIQAMTKSSYTMSDAPVRFIHRNMAGWFTPPYRCSRRKIRTAGSAPCIAGARAGGRSSDSSRGIARDRDRRAARA